MPYVTAADGTEIFYKDWGDGQPIVFHHGWPLTGDDWDTQMMFFLQRGFRVIAHDRRGHGRSSPSANGHDMDTYAADVASLATELDLRDAIHVGHSTGGGEVARYVARHGRGRVANAVLISAIPPLLVQTPANPGGVPMQVFDGLRTSLATDRPQFYREFIEVFYGYNRPGAVPSDGVRQNWWRQAMMGTVLGQHACVKAFSETDFTEDLKRIEVPTLVLHGEDDQVVPFANAGPKSARLLKRATFHAYPGLPHGMATTHAAQINADLLAFLRGQS